MNEDFSEKLKSVLADPQALARIAEIASGMGLSGADNAPAQTRDAPEATPAVSLPKAFSGVPAVDPRVALLNSLKPLLREDKRDRIDALTRALAVASLIGPLKDRK